MNRASLLAPPVGWLCHACGFSAAEKPERCPKCGNSAFERMGPAEAVRDAEREAEGLGSAAARGLAAVHRKETAMADLKCVDGCGAKVSRVGGRCRTCAGLLRQNKKGNKTRNKKAAPPTRPLSNIPLPEQAGEEAITAQGLAEALREAGFNVAEVRVQEATLLVRLTA